MLQKNKIQNLKVIAFDADDTLFDFKKTEISRHMYGRSTNDRNALCTIVVTVLPGLFQVDLHTDRVGYGLDGLVNTKQFEQGIAAESDS